MLGSKQCFGVTSRKAGDWWYLSKLYEVSPDVAFSIRYRTWMGAVPTHMGLSFAGQEQFIGEDDTFVMVVWYDENGNVTGRSSKPAFVSDFVRENNAFPNEQEWYHYTSNFDIDLYPNTKFAEVRIIAVDGNAQDVGDRRQYETWTGDPNMVWNAYVLFDDYEFIRKRGVAIDITGAGGIESNSQNILSLIN